MKTNIHLGGNSITFDQVVKAKEQMTKCLHKNLLLKMRMQNITKLLYLNNYM